MSVLSPRRCSIDHVASFSYGSSCPGDGRGEVEEKGGSPIRTQPTPVCLVPADRTASVFSEVENVTAGGCACRVRARCGQVQQKAEPADRPDASRPAEKIKEGHKSGERMYVGGMREGRAPFGPSCACARGTTIRQWAPP
eukprot:1183311-Prorocentrum_minimum.AAC.1